MKKRLKQITKFMAICALIALYGCEKELYEDTIYQSKLKVSYVNSTALENNKLLMKKLNNSSYFKKNFAGRIITDTINGFSIDTEKVKFVQGDNFNSYTFEIIKPDQTFLDNLVLMSKNQEEYKPYALRYTLTDEEKAKLNTADYIDFTNKCKASEINDANTLEEILAKYAYNEECNMVYEWQETISITPCDIDGCLNEPWATFSYGHTLIGHLVCSSGSSGDNGTTIGTDIVTSPHGGGSGGQKKTPCQQLKDLNTKPIANTSPPKTVLNNLNDLATQIATNPRERMFVMTPTTESENEYVETYVEGSLNGDGVFFSAGLNVLSIIMHCHYNISQYSIFSLQDLQQISHYLDSGNIINPETFTSIVVTAQGTKYAIKIIPQNNQLGNNNYLANFFAGWDFENIKKTREDIFEKKVTEAQTPAQNELGFLNFLKEQKFSFELYKADATFTQWTKLSLATNGEVIQTPCAN